ncbi:MAG: aminotransferase class V-fold PLP-dependent enzyme [Bacteroidota bacterium]
MSLDTANIRKQFPVLDRYVYADTATSGLLSQDLLHWRQGHDLDFLMGGSIMKTPSMHLITNTRDAVADFFGCESHNVSLAPNFSLGINLLLEGLDKKHKILLLENDYPSINWPFETRGFAIDRIPIDTFVENRIYEAVKNKGTTVFAFSLVQWLNGLVLDLEFLQKLKSEFPDLLIIADGTQFCGMFDFDFTESAIDVLGASTYKWLLSGYGNGFLLFKEEAKSFFFPKSIGCHSVGGNLSMKNTVAFHKLLEPGHLNTLSFGSLKFSLAYLNAIGMKNIAQKNKALSQKIKEELCDLQLLESTISQRNIHSTIFNIKGDGKLFQELTQQNIICAQRGEGIRLSFHFYNTLAEIEHIVSVLKKNH